jgi:hypothetical protein
MFISLTFTDQSLTSNRIFCKGRIKSALFEILLFTLASIRLYAFPETPLSGPKPTLPHQHHTGRDDRN